MHCVLCFCQWWIINISVFWNISLFSGHSWNNILIIFHILPFLCKYRHKFIVYCVIIGVESEYQYHLTCHLPYHYFMRILCCHGPFGFVSKLWRAAQTHKQQWLSLFTLLCLYQCRGNLSVPISIACHDLQLQLHFKVILVKDVDDNV